MVQHDIIFAEKDKVIEAMLVVNRETLYTYTFDINDEYWAASEAAEWCLHEFKRTLNARNIDLGLNEDEWSSLAEEIENKFVAFKFEHVDEDDDEDDDDDDDDYWRERDRAPRSESYGGGIDEFSECEFAVSAYKIEQCFESILRGHNKLRPGEYGIPKNLSFINTKGEEFFAKIDSISVIKQEEEDLLEDLIVARVGVAFRSPESDSIIAFSLGDLRKSNTSNKDLTYYRFDKGEYEEYDVEAKYSSTSSVFLYDLSKSAIQINSESPLVENLRPALAYYDSLLKELNKKEESIRVRVNLELLREYYTVFNSLTADDSLLVLPVYEKAKRINTISLQVEDYEGKKTKHNFYEGCLRTLSKEDIAAYKEILNNNSVSLPKDTALCLLDVGDSYEVKKRMTDGTVKACAIINNIEGERARLKRIVAGIKNVLSGHVANSKLVDLVCRCGAGVNAIDSICDNTYSPNEEYIEYLKNEYPVLRSNYEQLVAVDKIAHMEDNGVDVMLVQGPPGTGKTELILALAREFMKKNKKTLITSNVHVACDNVADRLKNYKELALKRYTTTRGEQYEKELVKNQRDYVKNQVLAGFQAEDIPVSSVEDYDALCERRKKLLERKQQMLASKEEYDEKLAPYNMLLSEKERAEKVLCELTERANAIIEQLRSAAEEETIKEAETRMLAAEIEKANEELALQTKELSSLKAELGEEQQQLNAFYAENNRNKEKINEGTEVIRVAEEEIAQTNRDIENNTKFKVFLAALTLSDIKHALRKKYLLGEEYPDKYYGVICDEKFADLAVLVDIHRTLSKDREFWEEGKALSNSSFEYIYYSTQKSAQAMETFIGLDIVRSFDEINTYYKASNLKKSISFLRIAGKKKAYYLNLIETLNKQLKTIQYCLDECIFSYIDTKISEKDMDMLAQNIEEQLQEGKKRIAENYALILQTQKSIEDCNDEIAKNRTAIALKSKSVVSLQNSVKDASEAQNQIVALIDVKNERAKQLVEEKEKVQSEARALLNEQNDTAKNIAHQEEALKTINREKEKVYSELEDAIKGYGAFIDRLNIDVRRLDKRAEALDSVINRIDKKAELLIKAGWKSEEAYLALFKYVEELETISTCDEDKVGNYLNGRGTTFDDMFKLENNNNGALISMTTNQVAALLNATTLSELTFDYAIIDEASKCRFEDIVISLPRVKHLILIGDFMQLDPMYEKYHRLDMVHQNMFSTEQWEMLNRSTFSSLLSQVVEYNESHAIDNFDDMSCVAVLKRQYRMNQGIFGIIAPIYSIHSGFDLIDEKQESSNDVMCVNVGGAEIQENDGTSFYNVMEKDAIVSFLRELQLHRDKYPSIKKIGVITGYREQERELRRGLTGTWIPGLQIGTFDRFQGREYDLVIVSLVRTKALGFTNDVRRMNVAFSRAKNHLLVFANFDALYKVANKKELLTLEERTNSDKKENEFVAKVLIPKLYGQKETFVSEEERTKAILGFIKENGYE